MINSDLIKPNKLDCEVYIAAFLDNAKELKSNSQKNSSSMQRIFFGSSTQSF